MSRPRGPSLWVALVAVIFFILAATGALLSGLMFLLTRWGLVPANPHNPVYPILAVLYFSIVVGSGIAVLVSRVVTRPITRISRAAMEIGRGNFDISIPEQSMVSEVREMARNFNKMAKDLSSIETLRDDFVVNISHEFRSPLAAIEGYTTLLQDESLTPEERREYTQIIIDSVRQLTTLSSNILRLSRLENQDIVDKTQLFSLDEQIRQVLVLLEPHWSAKDLSLDLDLAPVQVKSSEELLAHVWINLLGNAIKFTPPGGKITVVLTHTRSWAMVRIRDTGIGMTPETVRHIFEKFYQGDRSRATQGNGLGLPLVKRILHLCGGAIIVESEPGKGSRFTIRLPIK